MSAVMFPIYQGYTNGPVALGEDDIEGIQYLYGEFLILKCYLSY